MAAAPRSADAETSSPARRGEELGEGRKVVAGDALAERAAGIGRADIDYPTSGLAVCDPAADEPLVEDLVVQRRGPGLGEMELGRRQLRAERRERAAPLQRGRQGGSQELLRGGSRKGGRRGRRPRRGASAGFAPCRPGRSCERTSQSSRVHGGSALPHDAARGRLHETREVDRCCAGEAEDERSRGRAASIEREAGLVGDRLELGGW